MPNEKCKNCGHTEESHQRGCVPHTIQCYTVNRYEDERKPDEYCPCTKFIPTPYLDGVKVGDTLYNAERKEWVVIDVWTHAFRAKSKVNNVQRVFNFDGSLQCYTEFGTILFWQPPSFALPPKPKKKKKQWRIKCLFSWAKEWESEKFYDSIEDFMKETSGNTFFDGVRLVTRIEESMREVDE